MVFRIEVCCVCHTSYHPKNTHTFNTTQQAVGESTYSFYNKAFFVVCVLDYPVLWHLHDTTQFDMT